MKFKLERDLELLPLRRHLELEGHEVVDFNEDYRLGGREFRGLGMRWGVHLGIGTLVALGYTAKLLPTDFYLSRWFEKGKWHPQTFCGVPLSGLMDGGRSEAGFVGTVGSYIPISSGVESLFELPSLSVLLEELQHCGWVSIKMSFREESPIVCGLECGVPSWGLYCLLEGVPAGVGGFFGDPMGSRLRESWTVGVLVSRWPFPGHFVGRRTIIGGLGREVEKHFWIGEHSKFKDVITTDSTVIGVATAWGQTPWAAAARVRRTCESLRVEEIQFRTDAVEATKELWQKIRSWQSLR